MLLFQRVTYLSALLVGCALLPVSSLAQLSFQSHQVAQSSLSFGVSAHGDFNNDGREDVVAQGQLYLSNGDGTYAAPKALPASVDVIGDFNHDGKLDFASYKSPSAEGLAVYLGNGDGTFKSPRTVTSATPYRLVATDLNHDGKTDLVTVKDTSTGTGYPTTIQIWLSNGDGTFTQGQTITTANPGNASVEISFVLPGDFDGDGKPDLALIYTFAGPTTVQVFYGDGTGHLGTPSFLNDPNQYIDGPMISADVNNDGRSDIVSVAGVLGPRYGDVTTLPTLAIFTGNANRTLTYSTLATTQCAGALTAADFNGDGLNDLAYSQAACDQSSANNTTVIRPGAGSGTFGAEQTVAQSLYGTYGLSALRSTVGTKPDLVFVQTNGPSSYSLVLLTNTSTGAFPGCGLKGIAEGVAICTPGASSTSPVKFSVSSAGPTPMRTAAVWVDGKKVAEQLAHAFSNYSFLDASVALAAGSHSVTVFGTGWDDTLQQKSFTLTVGSGTTCAAPTSAGVHICQPASGATVSSPATVQAASTITGTLARMEIWVDGVKKFTETTSASFTTSLSLGSGKHRFDVYAVNTAGAKWESTVYATVQ